MTTPRKLRALVVPEEPEPSAQASPPADCEAACMHHRPVRLSWAKLLKRVFEIDMENCPNCGGELKIIAAILEQPVIEKIPTECVERCSAFSEAFTETRGGLAGPCRIGRRPIGALQRLGVTGTHVRRAVTHADPEHAAGGG